MEAQTQTTRLLKEDITKLITFKTYAQEKHKTVQAVYKMVKEGRLNPVEIDGKLFIRRE